MKNIRAALLLALLASGASAGVLDPPAIPYSATKPLPTAAAGWTARGRTPVIVSVGNSISWYGHWLGQFGYSAQFSANVSEIGNLLALSGGAVTQECNLTSGGTNFDQCGNFGDPAQTCPTIETDFTVFVNTWGVPARYAPNIWYDQSLVENDIAAGTSVAAIKACIQAVIGLQRTYSPGSVVILGTPHPDGRLSGVPAQIAVQKTIHDYILGLDDGETVFAVEQTTLYNDPGNAACTSAGWSSCPLQGYTFNSAPSDALTTVAIHPRQNAASLVGRGGAAAVKRIVGHLPAVYGTVQGNNLNLAGSVSIATTRVTGVGPTASSIITPPTGTAASVVGSVCSPGCWNLTFTADAGQPVDSFTARISSKALALSASRFRIYAQVRVNSGSASLALINPQYTALFTDSTQQGFFYNISNNVSNPAVQPVVYRDGDVLTFVSPPTSLTAGKTLNGSGNGNIISDLVVNSYGSTPISLTVLALNVIPVDAPGTPTGITVGASPYYYQNPPAPTTTFPTYGRQLVVVSGGTVSDISICRPFATCYTTGLTTGAIPTNPGDYLRVTWSALPMMTAVPLP